MPNPLETTLRSAASKIDPNKLATADAEHLKTLFYASDAIDYWTDEELDAALKAANIDPVLAVARLNSIVERFAGAAIRAKIKANSRSACE